MSTCQRDGCGKEFEPFHREQKYCSKYCQQRVNWEKKKVKRRQETVVKLSTKKCATCGVSIAHRDARAQYCEGCMVDRTRNGKIRPAHTPDREVALQTARFALERIKNRPAHVAALKRNHNGIKPLKASTQAAIDRVVAKAIANGTCYGTG